MFLKKMFLKKTFLKKMFLKMFLKMFPGAVSLKELLPPAAMIHPFLLIRICIEASLPKK